MAYDLVVAGGQVVTAGGRFAADVAVDGECIAAVGENLPGRRRIDATGCYVLPGAIDGHVHFADARSASVLTADSFATGSVAAAFGGVTTVVDFVESQPGEPLEQSLDIRRAEAGATSCIDFGLHMNIRDAERSRVAELPGIVGGGVPTFKLFMAFDAYRLDDATLLRLFEAVAASDALAIVHAENEDVIAELKRQLAYAGRTGARWHPVSSPPATESEAIHRALALARLTGARVLFFHVSTREGVREVARARASGQVVYGEACPQYLVLTDDAYGGDELIARALMVRPPLRGRRHQEALWTALAGGRLDIVSSDHTPRARAADPAAQVAGASGVETRLALVHTFGVLTGRLSLERWVDACCTRPASVFGLSRKGRLAPGYDADVVVFDPSVSTVLSAGALHSAIDYCIYDGIEVHGAAVTTICRGRVVIEDGRLVEGAGLGRFVRRSYTRTPA